MKTTTIFLKKMLSVINFYYYKSENDLFFFNSFRPKLVINFITFFSFFTYFLSFIALIFYYIACSEALLGKGTSLPFFPVQPNSLQSSGRSERSQDSFVRHNQPIPTLSWQIFFKIQILVF